MQTAFLYLGVFGLAAALLTLAAVLLCRTDFRPALEVVSRIRRLPRIVQLLLLAFVVQMVVHGSTKTNGNNNVEGGITNGSGYVEGGVTNGPSGLPPGLLGNPPPPALPGDGPATIFGFTPEQIAAGFVFAQVEPAAAPCFAPPGGVDPVAEWRLRGASDDLAFGPPFAPVSDAPAVFAGGRVQDRVRNPSVVFAPLGARLGVVPEANWGLVAGTNAQSMVWCAATASNTLVATWRDVLLGRDTNLPVSVQAEFFDDGSFAYRYDLRGLDAGILTNIAVVASIGGQPWSATLHEVATNAPFSVLDSPFSVSFRALDAADAKVADRDADGLSTFDEIFVHRTDPGLADTDGDGISDGDEVAQSLDPLAVSVPNDALLERLGNFQTNEAYSVAAVAVTNELVGYRLWDSFAATWPAGATNLVYERTVRIDRREGWQQYYLSSRPDSAGGWSLDGLLLEWEDSDGESGAATASPAGDSMYLPLSTNSPSSVTFRLRATASGIRSARPVYLVGYAPKVSIEGGGEFTTPSGDVLSVFLDGSDSAIGVSVDRSRRPCKAALWPGERIMRGIADVDVYTSGGLRYEGGLDGGRIVASGAGVYPMPDVSVRGVAQAPANLRGVPYGGGGRYLVVLMPWIRYGESHCAGDGLGWDGREYVAEYEYPLDSGCLVREWRRNAVGAWNCDCVPRAGCGLPDDNGFVSVSLSAQGERATASLKIGGDTLWTGSAVHVVDLDGCGGTVTGIERVGECGDCESDCAHGDCSGLEGASMGSLRFRIPMGTPRKGQVAGFAYFTTEEPMMVTPAVFRYVLRNDVGASVTTNGSSRTVACACERGRRLVIEPIPNGTHVTVSVQATGALEHTWEIVNVGGSANEIRLRQISRLNNVMQDWTYEYAYNEESGKWDWCATDNIAGVREELEKTDLLNVDGSVSETRTKYDLDGNWLGSVETRSEIVGERECGALREVYRREYTANNVVERFADYWRDTAHPARNGLLRLLQADDAPWEYHEWNEDGLEVLRVEQRNGSAVPADFPAATSNGFENAAGLADAFLTTFSYEPLDGDDEHADDFGKVRCESRYVVRGGVATLTGRTWRRFTHTTADWRPAVQEETWRASSAASQFGDASNAYSWRTVFDPVADGDVPLVLRGETAEEMDENGVRTACDASVSGGRVVLTKRRWRGALQFPTYDVVEMDDAYGLVLREAKYLTGSGAVVDETVSVYDDQSRLRSAAYHDGTSTTNSYSCCRLLWSRDRQGRRTLRSALTGQDGLYYAEEDVWLADVSTNGRYRVTQHFFDGLGRETNVVVYAGSAPGEATDFSASDGRRLTEERTQYAGTGNDAVDTVDVRGKAEMRRTSLYADREVSVADTYAGESAPGPMTHVVRTDVRNGPGTTRREWDGKWSERRTWSDYDAAGCRVDYGVTVSSDCGTVTNSVTWYDFLGRRVASQSPSGTETTVYDGSTHRALSTTVASGGVVRTTENLYDDFGELVGNVRDGATSRREEAYEEESNVWWKVVRTAVSAASGTNSVSVTRERVTGLSDAVRSQVVRISPDGVATETTESYDPVSGVTVETTASPVDGTVVRTLRHGLVLSVATPSGTTEYAYDALGRRVRETCGARVVETDYNAAGDVVARRTRTGEGTYAEETYAYDVCGNRVVETNALGCVTTTAYDTEGNVVEVSGPAAYPVRFAYDTEGRRTLLSTTRDGTIWDVTTWEYDPATGNCLAKRHADGSRYATAYTPDGLEAVVTRPSQQWRENVYDAKRQLVGVVSNDGSENAAFEYDDFGRMTAASNAVAYTTSVLHRNGTATNEVVSIGTNSFEIGRTVDMFGRQDGRGVVGSEFQCISYDGIGRVGSIADQTATVTYAYSEDGMEAGYAISLSAGANVVRQVSRDVYRPDLVAAVSNVVNGVAVSGFGYQRDAEGRVLSRNGDTFAYNERGEVVFSSRGAEEDSYAYDQIGNFTGTVCGGVTNVYTANELNQYESVGSVSLSFTSDGGVVTDGLLQFAYDSAGRLSTVSTGGVEIAAFQYDALGRRVRKTTPDATHTYLYDGWNLVLERIERDGGETDTVEYLWGKDMSGALGGAGGIGGLLYLKHNGAAYIPLYDASGNIVQYVDATGAVVASYVYDAFGRTLASSGPQADLFRFRFSTKYHDPESGLVYFGYRFYSPVLARWLTRDPLEEQGGLNLYGFCGNDALNHTDPYGLIMGIVGPSMAPFPIMTKCESKLFWLSVAELYFRVYENCPISAEMLELSIFGNVGFGRHIFPEGGELANAIKNSSEYNAIIRELVANQNLGRSSYNEHKSTKFNSKDLKTAVGHSDYELTGEICKLKNGSARLNLKMKVLDTYNFEWWGYEKVKVEGLWLTAGNNLAWAGQMVGDLKTYPWSVSFDDNRRWTWRGKSETRLVR